uniref:Rho-GAP domain-containing protein n=1 Tax=Hucho hucho TaxID=62062 RepID=A0A4W5KRQ1_9TELE
MPIGAVAQQEGVLVPHVVRCCVEEVERRGMEEVGIYRLSAATSDMNNLKTAFNTNLREAVSRLRCVDVNAVSGILKLYFRELPEPLIPTELFQSFTKALDIPDLSSRSVSMLSLLQSCPLVNQNTFLFLLHHLKRSKLCIPTCSVTACHQPRPAYYMTQRLRRIRQTTIEPAPGNITVGQQKLKGERKKTYKL